MWIPGSQLSTISIRQRVHKSLEVSGSGGQDYACDSQCAGLPASAENIGSIPNSYMD